MFRSLVKNVIVAITRKAMQHVQRLQVKIRLNSVGWFSAQNVEIHMLVTRSMATNVINK